MQWMSHIDAGQWTRSLAENHFELDYSFLKTDTSIAWQEPGNTLCDQDGDFLHSTAGLHAGEAPK